ncbi:MAG: coproporphyrinogen dehydrogenase HemZ [Clostridia bacterium]
MRLKTDYINFAPELFDEVKMFVSELKYELVTNEDTDIADENDLMEHSVKRDGINYISSVKYKGIEINMPFVIPYNSSELMCKKLLKRYSKLSVYNCMKRLYNCKLPWGALTGIRPTRVMYEILENGLSINAMQEIYDVSKEKCELVEKIIKAQKGLINEDEKAIDIYVGIPFCVSKCTYCTFTSGLINKLKVYVEPYIETLIGEIKEAFEIIKEGGYRLENVYFGGGTPTSLNAEQLKRLVELFDSAKIQEFTVEAGRPDTITTEHLEMLKQNGVNRISINPQTFNNETLALINRKHTIEQIYESYYKAKEYGFIINMDLIAGLPQENFEMFKKSLDECVLLDADNITVHTLALKRGSVLYENAERENNEVEVARMIEYAYNTLCNKGYIPYYLYRQKYMTGNLENVGYCKEDKQCRYNIDIMEERKSILACGSNSISKKVYMKEGRIERLADTKDVKLYVERGDGNSERKKKLFCC